MSAQLRLFWPVDCHCHVTDAIPLGSASVPRAAVSVPPNAAVAGLTVGVPVGGCCGGTAVAVPVSVTDCVPAPFDAVRVAVLVPAAPVGTNFTLTVQLALRPSVAGQLGVAAKLAASGPESANEQ